MGYTPPPPRRPSPRARALIYKYTGSQYATLFIGIAFLVIGLPITAFVCWGLPGELALAMNSRMTEGHVVQAELDEQVKINGEHPTRVDFRFEVDGVSYETGSTFVGVSAQAFGVGAPVDVEYVPWRPRWSRIAGGSYSFFPWWCVFVAIFPLIGGALTFAAVRSNRREIRAYRHGQPASGEVVFHGPDTSVEVNGRHPTKVEWVFLVAGVQYRGEVTHMDAAFLMPYQVGVSLVVLYDPTDPRINTLWVD